MVKVYCLGSAVAGDELALKFVGSTIGSWEFVKYSGEVCEEMRVMDVVKGITSIIVLGLDEFLAKHPVTMHDFDYGTELRLRMAVGEIKSVKVIALPYGWSYDQVLEKFKEFWKISKKIE